MPKLTYLSFEKASWQPRTGAW